MSFVLHEPKPDYRYRYFGAFRLLLAALVMLQHFAADLAPEPLATALAPYGEGSMAVLVFFALSGFVITEAVDSCYRKRPGAFLVNRLLRIVPHFLIAVALSMIAHEIFRATGGLRLWRSHPSFPEDAFAIRNVLLNLIGIVPLADRFIDYNFLGITWAVRVEMAFYIVICACIAAGARIAAPRGFALAAGGALVLAVPLFYFAVRGHGVAMLSFVPYFAFGSGLYFATAGGRAGWLVLLLSIPAIIWQRIAEHPPADRVGAIPPSVTGDLIVLIALLSVLVALAFANISKWRATDRFVGNLTYPLYLYHEVVLVVILTFTTGYSYSMFCVGILLSLLVAGILMAVVEPAVTKYRDYVRGRSLQQFDDRVSEREAKPHSPMGSAGDWSPSGSVPYPVDQGLSVLRQIAPPAPTEDRWPII